MPDDNPFVAIEGVTIQKLAIDSAKIVALEANASVGIFAVTAKGATVDRVIIMKSKVSSESAETVAAGGMFGKVTVEVAITNSAVKRLLIKTIGDAITLGGFVGNVESVVTMDNCAAV